VRLSKPQGGNPLRNPTVNLRSPETHRPLDSAADAELAALKLAGLQRRMRTVGGLQGARMRVDGRDVLMLAGSNYLDLAGDPRVVEASAEAVQRYGAAAGGARLISGNLELHEELEGELAEFCGTEAALVFSTGYMANLGVLTTLAGPGDVIVSDSLNHASIIDACRLAGAETRIFEHNAPGELAAVAATLDPKRRAVLVLDGVYSMDGDHARLAELVPIAREHGMWIVLDDVHGFGVLGAGGRGTSELEEADVDVLIASLGKALGSFGAFVACSTRVREWLINRARSFIFTCGLAPGPLGAARRALEIMRAEPERRETLALRSRQLRDGLRTLGYDSGRSNTHIVPVLIGSNQRTMELCEHALERGVYAQGIRYPSVPEGSSRIRLTPMCGHSSDDVQTVLSVFGELR
jgi:8-amino-7-oxononanoate synthase